MQTRISILIVSACFSSLSCDQTKDTSIQRSKSNSTENENSTDPSSEKDEDVAIISPNKSGRVSLGKDAEVLVAEGTANEEIRVTIRRSQSTEIEDSDAVKIDSAATDSIEIEVVSEQSGQPLDRTALKKPLTVIRTVDTDRNKDSIRPAVAAERANGTTEVYLVEKGDTTVSETSLGLVRSLFVTTSTRTLKYEFNLRETKARAALVFLDGGSGRASGSGSGSGSGGGSSTGTQTGATNGGGTNPDAIWSGNHLSGLTLGSFDPNFSFALDTDALGELESVMLQFQVASDGYIYFLSRTPYAQSGTGHGGVRRMTANGTTDTMFNVMHSSAGMTTDTPTAFLVEGNSVYIAGVGPINNEAVITRFKISDGSTLFARTELNACDMPQNNGDCKISTIVNCSQTEVCVFGNASIATNSTNSFFFAAFNKTTGQQTRQSFNQNASHMTLSSGQGVLHSGGYFYGITSKYVDPQNPSTGGSLPALARSSLGTMDATFGVINYPHNGSSAESSEPLAVIEDSQGKLLILASTASSTNESRIIKVNPDGSRVSTLYFDATMGGTAGVRIADSYAHSIAALPEGKFAVGWTKANGRAYVSVFNSDGSPSNIFNSGITNYVELPEGSVLYRPVPSQMKYVGNGMLLIMGYENYPSTTSLNKLIGWKIAIN